MQVPFNDLHIPTRQIQDQYIAAVEALLRKSHFILTEEVKEFEKRWSRFVGAKYCIGVSNGADALYLSLAALGIGPGDEVITQGNAYNATVTAILRTGAVPRFVDIRPDTLQIDVSKIAKRITKKTKAILPVHLYGMPGDLRELLAIAKKNHLAVVEDCAQAHGALYDGRQVGNRGKAAGFSFYPTKNLGAFGDAGAVVTNDKSVYQEILARRDLGQVAKNVHQYFGTNMRLDPLQAVALLLKLNFLPQWTAERQAAAKYYDQLFAQTHLPIMPISLTPRATNVYHLYVVQILKGSRDKLRNRLLQHGIQTAVHYPTPVYRQPFYRGPIDSCPVTDRVAKQILSLPMFLGITKKQQEYVVSVLAELWK